MDMNLGPRIEVLLQKAAVEPAFAARLLEARGEAAADIGLELTETETTMLRSVDREQLASVIAGTTPPPGAAGPLRGSDGEQMLPFATRDHEFPPKVGGIRPDLLRDLTLPERRRRACVVLLVTVALVSAGAYVFAAWLAG